MRRVRFRARIGCHGELGWTLRLRARRYAWRGRLAHCRRQGRLQFGDGQMKQSDTESAGSGRGVLEGTNDAADGDLGQYGRDVGGDANFYAQMTGG